MTLKTDIKFDDSPVLRSLEKVAIDKGLVTPDSIVKEANEHGSYEPSGNLHDDMLLLVSGLRERGFNKEAEALEDLINMRKLSETHLYRAIDEDGEDLLDFAHPEGDVEIAPSSSGLGKVWTEQSAKKEILKVVRKQPTGKNASVKEAQLQPISKEEALTWIANNAAGYVTNLVRMLDNKVDDLFWWEDRAFGLSQEKIIAALAPEVASYLREWTSYNYDPRSVMRSIWNQMMSNYNLGQWFNGEDLWVGKLWNAGKTGNGFDFVKGQHIGRLAEQYESAKKPEGDIPREYVTQISGRLNDAIKWLKGQEGVAKTESRLNTIFTLKNQTLRYRSSLNRLETPTTLEKMKEALGPDFANVQNLAALMIWAKNWVTDVMGIVRSASSDNDMTKTAQPTAAQIAGQPAQPVAAPAKPTAGVGQSVTFKIQEELDRIADTLDAVEGSSKQLARLFRETGPSNNPTYNDGVFGSHVANALKEAEKVRLFLSADKKRKTPASHKRFPIGYDVIGLYPDLLPITDKPDANNIEALKKLNLAIIGAYNKIKNKGSGYKQDELYDLYPDQSGAELTATSLSSLYNFYSWLLNNGVEGWELKDYQGNEIIVSADFDLMLRKIAARAKALHAGAAGQEDKTLAVKYVRAIHRLYKNWVDLLKGISEGGTYPAYVFVDQLQSAGAFKGFDQKSEEVAGSGYKQSPRGEGRAAGGMQAEFIGDEAAEGFSVDDVPISRYIDLNNKEWWDLDQNLLLDYNEFSRMTGGEFADTYFSGVRSTNEGVQLYHAAVQAYGKDRVRFAKNGRVIVWPYPPTEPPTNRGGRAKWHYADTLQQVMTRFNMLGSDPGYHAINFLVELRNEITKVISKWNNALQNPEIRKRLIPPATRDARLWQRKIGRMIQDVGRQRRRG